MCWNIDGVQNKFEFQSMIDYLKSYNVFGLLETWEINLEKYSKVFPDHKCFVKNAFKYRSRGRAMAGICVFVHKSLLRFCEQLQTDSNFCIFLKFDKCLFNSIKDMLICFTYLPPDNSPAYRDENLKGIDLLEHYISQLELNPLTVDIMIMGDLNARTGNEKDFIDIVQHVPELDEYNDVWYAGIPDRTSCDNVVNRSGIKLLEFCKMFGICIVNGRSGNDKGVGNFTFVNSNGSSVIDYMLISNDCLDRLANFSIGERTESCHFPLEATVLAESASDNVSDSNCSNHAKNQFYLIKDSTIESIRNTLMALLDNNGLMQITNLINNTHEQIDNVLEKVLEIVEKSLNCCKQKQQTHKKLTQPPWFDSECWKGKREKIKALQNYRKDRTPANLDLYLDLKQNFKRICKKKKNDMYDKKLNELVQNASNPKSFWKKLKRLTNTPIATNNIQIDDWKIHFEQLFAGTNDNDVNVLTSDDDLNEIENSIFNAEITDEEIALSIQALKAFKSPGEDGIPPIFFKHTVDMFMPVMVRLFNRLFKCQEFPTAWSSAIIVPLFKKGDHSNPANYRGISLLDIFGEIYTSIINRRLTFFVNIFDKIDEAQSGFRSGYSTVDNAFVLQSLISKVLSRKRGKMYVAFIDFKTAFDSVVRGKLWEVLMKADLKGNLYKSIEAMYRQVKARVRSNGYLSDYFDCPVGLKQGCMASPQLFSLFINELALTMKQDQNLRGIQLQPNDIEILLLMFADDVALLADTVIGLQRQLNVLYNFCQTSYLKVNSQKSKVMVFKKGGRLSRHETWTYGGEKLDIVPSFSYVGVTFTSGLSLNSMASEMAIKAKKALLSILSSLYEYGQLPYSVYFKLFDTKIQPILLYGSEIWGFKSRDVSESVLNYACKRFLCVSRNSTNAAVLGDCGRYPLVVESAKRSLKYWLKILKMPDERYVKKCYAMLLNMPNNSYFNWAKEMENLLCQNGFGYVWYNQLVDNENMFLKLFTQRLKDKHMQYWHSYTENCSKLKIYKNIKFSYDYEHFVDVLSIRKFRHCYAQFRTGVHDLEIERGRYHNLPLDQRLCKVCSANVVEDEFHFILNCRVYADIRLCFIPSKYFMNPCLHKLHILLSSKNDLIIKNVAQYIYQALHRRKLILQI